MFKMKKLFAVVLMMFMAVGSVFSSQSIVANAEAKVIDVTLRNLSLTTQKEGEAQQSETVTVKFDWDASSAGLNIKEGDYFIIDLPKALDLSSKTITTPSFDLANRAGEVLAKAVVDSSTNKVTVTFNVYAENRNDVAGTMEFKARISKSETTVGQKTTIEIQTGSSVVKTDVTVKEGVIGDKGDTFMWKSGTLVTEKDEQGVEHVTKAQWNVRINNTDGKEHTDIVFIDTLQGKDGTATDEVYITNIFLIREVRNFDSNGKGVTDENTITLKYADVKD